MKDVIKKLVEIDEQAKAFGEETKKQKEEYEARIKDEADSVYEKYMSDAREEVEAQKKVICDESERKFQKKKSIRDEQIKKLNQQYEDNSEKWIEQIVNEVLA